MIVCIAEKPSVARDIADVLGAKDRRDGYIEGNGYQVTWTFGHLCTLKEPHEYTPNWKSWSLGSLPMIPPRFGIKLISNPTYEKQFHTIETLMQKADMIINCGDAGQEGELIQRWVMQKAGARCPVKRLWISSLTEEAIREGFAKLKDQKEFQPLYEAGLSRAIGDWLLGMNATRLYTMKYGQNKQALKDYAHFTSPIRRYPDLAIHRILSNYCENPNAEAMHEKYDAFVIEASMRSSDTEVRAITIERNADDCYKAEYMQQHLGEIFDGIIAGVTDFGFYVALPNTVEGLVHVSTLPESDWINDDSIAFKEEQGSACYRLGDTVRVQCTKIDVNSGNVDFALVEEGQEAAAK